MASYIDVAAPSIISGVWDKKDTICRLMEEGIQVDVQIEIHSDPSPPNLSLPTPPTHAIINTRSSCYRSCVSDSPARNSVASLPPSYSSVVDNSFNDDLYTEEEPLTLAQMLFKYGFLFFPFWIAGAYILCSPLRPTPEWESGKTEAEKVQQLAVLRKTELKWARRCLLGIFAMTTLIFLSIPIIKYGILRTL
ncbi:hypothetical protein BU17DRAFT_81341 [Hysterangium stoloniferum]|nr:hypothetical protein BU17DRAFT_81341 [Hysterangium stoloniferum]